MRWLLIAPGPSWSVADVFNGWSEALTGLGETVEEYPLDAALRFYNSALAPTGKVLPCGCPETRQYLDRDQAARLALDPILAAANRFWPDVILCTSGFFLQPWLLEILHARRHTIVFLATESPYQDDYQLKVAQYADLTLLNDPVNIQLYRDIGPAEYMPHAYRERIHYPPPLGAEPEYDLAFVGTGFPSRVRFFHQMDLAGLNVRLGGLWMDLPEDSPMRDWTAITDDADDCVDNHEAAAIYRPVPHRDQRVPDRSRGRPRGRRLGRRAPRDRDGRLRAVVRPRPAAPNRTSCSRCSRRSRSPEEAGDLIRWAVAHPEARAIDAAKARAAVADRTFTEHAKQLLRLLDRQPIRM